MKATEIVTKVIHLELNYEEAEWIKNLAQNCHHTEYGEEPIEERKIRENLFNALNNLEQL